MARSTRSPYVSIHRPTGLATCPHRDSWGDCCDSCFHARPYLVRLAEDGVARRMDGTEWQERPELIAAATVSAATPRVEVIPVTSVKEDDRILGLRPSPQAPLIVGRVVEASEDSLEIIACPGARMRIDATHVTVARPL